MDDSADRPFAINLEAAFEAFLEILQVGRFRRQLAGDIEADSFVRSGRQALLRSRGAAALKGRLVLRLGFLVADRDIEALLDFATGPALFGLAVVLGWIEDKQTLALKQADDIEARGFAHYEIVATVIDGEPVMDQNVAFTIAVAGELQTTNHAIAVHGAVV